MFRNIHIIKSLSKKHSNSSLSHVAKLCTSINGASLISSLQDQMKSMHQEKQSNTNTVSIYRVPPHLRKVEPTAYDPHFISIGPYHHNLCNLHSSENLKLRSLDRLLGNDLGKLLEKLGSIEEEARACYSEDLGGINRDDFIKMMLLDGCFIIQLFRDLKQTNFTCSPLFTKRWMLPVVRRDLFTLENQIPMIVLKKIFSEIESVDENEFSLEELAIRFFDPLMPREAYILRQSIESCSEANHLLDVFHKSISLGETVKRCKEPHMYRSVTDLKEAGIKVRVLRNSMPLRMEFLGVRGGLLKIPRLLVDDHTGSFFRNIVAYEQCHQECKPDMTTYLFFLDKLINSAEDVGLLHYGGVIEHSLGSNEQLAKLINNLCTEVEHDREDSYLCEVIENLNAHSDKWWVKLKAKLKHGYFTNLWVSLSTFAGVLLIYLTLVQTSCEVMGVRSEEELGWWRGLNLFLVRPIKEVGKMFKSFVRSIVEDIDPDDPEEGGPSQFA